MIRKEIRYLSMLTRWVGRYEAYCASLATHGGVAPPRNGTTIPRRRALPCAAMNAHYTSSNYGFQVEAAIPIAFRGKSIR
jgi:hypothetical protein